VVRSSAASDVYKRQILERFAILCLRTVSTVEFQSVVFWISGSGVDGG
jgi:hypothetical protein